MMVGKKQILKIFIKVKKLIFFIDCLIYKKMIGILSKLPTVILNKIDEFENFKFSLLMDGLPMEMVNLIASYNKDLLHYFEGPSQIAWSDIRHEIEFILFQTNCIDFIEKIDNLVNKIDPSISVFYKGKYLYYCKESMPGGGKCWNCYDELMDDNDRVKYADKLVEFLRVADHFIEVNNEKYRNRVSHLNDIYKLIFEYTDNSSLELEMDEEEVEEED